MYAVSKNLPGVAETNKEKSHHYTITAEMVPKFPSCYYMPLM
jgi:hypothetical protein